MPKVTEIVDEKYKSGVGAKGEWSISLVRMEGGREVSVFNPVKLGDELELYESEKDGKTYKNWRVQRTGGATQSKELLEAIFRQNEQVLELLGTIHALVSGKAVDSLESGDKDEPDYSTYKKNEEQDEDINLDAIPF